VPILSGHNLVVEEGAGSIRQSARRWLTVSGTATVATAAVICIGLLVLKDHEGFFFGGAGTAEEARASDDFSTLLLGFLWGAGLLLALALFTGVAGIGLWIAARRRESRGPGA
jgi:purine-cytosine permease-like protein